MAVVVMKGVQEQEGMRFWGQRRIHHERLPVDSANWRVIL